MKKIFFIFLLSIISLTIKANTIGSETGYKIPRFVSLKSDDSNLRIGSSTNYPILMKYITTNLPLEIKEEYKEWRKVSDYEGNQGWIHESLIKGDRYAIIHQAYNEPIQVYNKPQGKIIGKFGKNNIVKINECLLNWCLVSKSKNTGWVIKKNLWGIYNDEKINIPFYHPLRQIIWKLLN